MLMLKGQQFRTSTEGIRKGSGLLCLQGLELRMDKKFQVYDEGSNINLIFISPYIVIYSYSTTNKMHLLSQIIYSCKTLYMFRTVFPSVIRSSKLCIQQRYMSNSCCYLLLLGIRWNSSPISSSSR